MRRLDEEHGAPEAVAVGRSYRRTGCRQVLRVVSSSEHRAASLSLPRV